MNCHPKLQQRLARSAAGRPFTAAAFPTELGWMAMLTLDGQLAWLTFDHADRQSALDELPAGLPATNRCTAECSIQRQLEDYAAGEPLDLAEVSLVPRWTTPFARRVVEACRAIAYGETLTYGELARVAGSPGAARAVGNLMATNHVPLVVPCHRVVGSQGALGGYSARGGLAIKRHLLAMEQASSVSCVAAGVALPV